MMIFRSLYNLALHLLALISLPYFLYSRIRYGKYKNFFLRCGFGFPKIEKDKKMLVWIHAVSVGETKAIAALVQQLKKSSSNIQLVISNITESGHAEAKRVINEADNYVYLPFDLPYIIRPIVRKVKPDLVIISESDFWFHFQDSCKEIGAKLVLVNGKISERSFRRYGMLPWLSGQLFYLFDLICCQSETYRRRFMDLGVAPEQTVVTGNLKLDDAYPCLTPMEIESWKNELKIPNDSPILVIGSSHDPEEKIVMEALKQIWKEYPALMTLIVPRKPERFEAVFELVRKEGISVGILSKKEEIPDDAKMIIVDQMGILRQCYQLADIAIVGGTFNEKIGGHNLLEPSWYGVPVIYGPYVHTQTEMAKLVQRYGAGIQVESSSLAEALIALLKDKEKRLRIGESGRKIFQEASGATAKTLDAIHSLFSV